MHRWRIEHIAAELLICRSPASISNYIFSAVFTYFWGGFLHKKRWVLGRSPRPRWGSLQRSPTPLSWAGGVPPSRTLPGAAPPTTSPHPWSHPPPLPIPGSATADGTFWTAKKGLLPPKYDFVIDLTYDDSETKDISPVRAYYEIASLSFYELKTHI